MARAKKLESLRSLTVLYIEDEEEVLNALASILQRRTKELFLAKNGKEGLELYKKHRPDIIITDIKMPIMNGLKMAEIIRQDDYTTPIIVTSAFNDNDYLMRAIEIGINQFVLKPIDAEKLFTALENSIRLVTFENRLEQSNRDLKYNLKLLTEYKNAIDVSSIVSVTDPEGIICDVNDEFCRITGYTKEELIGQTHLLIKSHDPTTCLRDEIAIAKKANEIFRGLIKNRHKNGEEFYLKLTIVPILDDNNQVIEYVEFRDDVTQIIEQVYTDPLTGYPNRAALIKAMAVTERPLLYLINLDAFKDINDFYGNSSGDHILVELTGLLARFIHNQFDNAKLYKLSGDEYAVMIDCSTQIAYGLAKVIAQTLSQYIEGIAFNISGTTINISSSIGYGISSTNVLANADMALKYAKINHKDYVCFEDVAYIEQGYEDNIIWTKKLKEAINTNHIVPFYQPIIDNKTGEIVKFECLMRLIDGSDKVITPFHFLDISIKAKLYHKLTKIMIEKSFQEFCDKTYDFSINITASDIFNQEVHDFLIEKINEYNVSDRLILEIVESEGFDRYDEIKNFIDTLKSMGCRIAIDDFGSGYSNFEHIIKLNVDFIKIDGSLIKDIHEDKNSHLVAQMITLIAQQIGAKTIAEYVHNDEVYQIIKELGIHYSQGFYFGAPAPKITK